MNRRGAASIAANPVLIGAATTLVVIVAVFLAYNANNGLPFVPTYDLKAVVPNAAQLVPGNEVRVGGSRVGVIDDITPVRTETGATNAVLHMKLETVVQPLPRDSTVIVRPRSALGLKYVEITKGNSTEGFDTGETVPVAQATPEPVDIDEFLRTFDEPTRAASRKNLDEFGTAIALRGSAINDALGIFPTLLRNLQPVAENLSDPDTDLEGLFRGLGQAAAEAAPVAEQQAAMFRGLDTTFGALADVTEGIQETITTGPPALDAAIESFPIQRPFLRNSELLMADFRPGIKALRRAAPDLSYAFQDGQAVLKRSVELNERLKPTFVALQEFAEDPLTTLGINGLKTAVQILDPTVADLAPVQTKCNFGTLFFRNAASLLSEGDSAGTWQRFIIVAAVSALNNEGGPSSAPASGGAPENYLHTNPYPNTPGGSRTNECEAGNEGWVGGRVVAGNVPGNQSTNTESTQIVKSGNLPSNKLPFDQAGGGSAPNSEGE